MITQDSHFNIGHICTKQQCENGFADKVAFCWWPADHKSAVFTFQDLDLQSDKIANVLSFLGIKKGEIIFTSQVQR